MTDPEENSGWKYVLSNFVIALVSTLGMIVMFFEAKNTVPYFYHFYRYWPLEYSFRLFTSMVGFMFFGGLALTSLARVMRIRVSARRLLYTEGLLLLVIGGTVWWRYEHYREHYREVRLREAQEQQHRDCAERARQTAELLAQWERRCPSIVFTEFLAGVLEPVLTEVENNAREVLDEKELWDEPRPRISITPCLSRSSLVTIWVQWQPDWNREKQVYDPFAAQFTAILAHQALVTLPTLNRVTVVNEGRCGRVGQWTLHRAEFEKPNRPSIPVPDFFTPVESLPQWESRTGI